MVRPGHDTYSPEAEDEMGDAIIDKLQADYDRLMAEVVELRTTEGRLGNAATAMAEKWGEVAKENAQLREVIESVYDFPYPCHGCNEFLSGVSELVNHDCPGE